MMSSQLETQSSMPVHSYHPKVKSPFSPVTEYSVSITECSVSITEYSVSVKVKYDNPDVLCISERDNGKAISNNTLLYMLVNSWNNFCVAFVIIIPCTIAYRWANIPV